MRTNTVYVMKHKNTFKDKYSFNIIKALMTPVWMNMLYFFLILTLGHIVFQSPILSSIYFGTKF